MSQLTTKGLYEDWKILIEIVSAKAHETHHQGQTWTLSPLSPRRFAGCCIQGKTEKIGKWERDQHDQNTLFFLPTSYWKGKLEWGPGTHVTCTFIVREGRSFSLRCDQKSAKQGLLDFPQLFPPLGCLCLLVWTARVSSRAEPSAFLTLCFDQEFDWSQIRRAVVWA